MRRFLFPLMLLLLALTVGGCVDEDSYDDTPQGNFEALWKIMDEHYCFFDYKKQTLGIDWAEVYRRYKPMVNGANTEQLFEVLSNMLAELKDGHVNLSAGFDYGRNWSWKEEYPTNFSDTIYNRYMGTDYRIASGICYRILDDNIGYMRVSSFENEPGDGNIDEVLLHFIACRSLIIDIRENGGGMVTAAEKLASRFTNEDILVGYIQHKTGTGHNDFSAMKEQRLKPSSHMRWQKPVFVLTNRGVFSAANEFVMYMKQCPKVTVIGDRTGGGAGMPFTSELPNGWGVRFSAVPMYDVDKNSTEHGIDPDIYCSMTDADFQKGRDTIIEQARSLTK
jgi:hypothetical protein